MLINLSVIFTLLTLLAGLAVNVGTFESRQTQLQAAAEAAATAGSLALQRAATTLPTPTSTQLSQDAVSAGRAMATLNGFTNGANGVTVTIENPPSSGTYSGNSNAIRATVQQSLSSGFLSLLRIGNVSLQGQATHAIQTVDLSSYYNVDAIVMDGAYIASNGGVDGGGAAFSAKTFAYVRNQNPSLYIRPGLMSWRGNLFLFEAPSTATSSSNVTYNGVLGGNVSLPNAQYSQIQLIALTANGVRAVTQPSFIVTYKDNSTLTQTFKMTDWWCQGTTAGPPEQIVLQAPYMDAGGQSGGWYYGGTSSPYYPAAGNCMYGYYINLDNTKKLKSLTLPAAGTYGSVYWTVRPVILAIDLVS